MNILIAEDDDYFMRSMARKLYDSNFFADGYAPDLPDSDVTRAVLTQGLRFTRGDVLVNMVSTTRQLFREIEARPYEAAFVDHTIYNTPTTLPLSEFLQQRQKPVAFLISNEGSRQLAALQEEMGMDEVNALQASCRLRVVAEKRAAPMMALIDGFCAEPDRPLAGAAAWTPPIL